MSNGLLTDEEYATVMQIPGAVNRLEGYDGIRVERDSLQKALKEAQEKIAALTFSYEAAQLNAKHWHEHSDRFEAERDSLRKEVEAAQRQIKQLTEDLRRRNLRP